MTVVDFLYYKLYKTFGIFDDASAIIYCNQSLFVLFMGIQILYLNFIEPDTWSEELANFSFILS